MFASLLNSGGYDEQNGRLFSCERIRELDGIGLWRPCYSTNTYFGDEETCLARFARIEYEYVMDYHTTTFSFCQHSPGSTPNVQIRYAMKSVTKYLLPWEVHAKGNLFACRSARTLARKRHKTVNLNLQNVPIIAALFLEEWVC